MTKVLGYVMAKNSWPLLGIAIINAFNIGISHVIAVNHNSSDGTAEGLKKLSNLFPGKITIINNSEKLFLQEKTAREILKSFNTKLYDWVYVFDADEIMMLHQHKTLSEILTTIPDEFQSVRYHIDQWAWTRDLDDSAVENYSKLFFRAELGFDYEKISDDLIERAMNFFSIPFPSKVLIRADISSFLLAGAHGTHVESKEFFIAKKTMSVGHIPFTSLEKLKHKSKHGADLIDAGFPDWHGWQEHALFALDNSNRLNDFWIQNSVPPNGRDGFVFDNSLSFAVKKCLTFATNSLF